MEEETVRRRHLVAMALAAIIIAAATLGAAPAASDEAGGSAIGPTVAVQRVTLAIPAVREEAAMVVLGSALIALAAALRRSA